MKQRLLISCAGVVLAGACVSITDESVRTQITEPNRLGVHSIEVDRFDEDQVNVFELRGLDASGSEVARIGVRSGLINDPRMPAHWGGVGSEIVITSSGGKELYGVTSETRALRLPNGDLDTGLKELIKLDAVSAALADARFVSPAVAVEDAYAYSGSTWDCIAGELNTNPPAGQCCSDHWGKQRFYALATGNSGAQVGDLIDKWKSPYGPCKAYGGGSCSGSACDYGPNGFARPYNWGSSYYYQGNKIVSIPEYECPYDYYDEWGNCVYGYQITGYDCQMGVSAYATEFPTAYGTFATGQGCPGGGTGAGQWDP
jgi:hypothetical protein